MCARFSSSWVRLVYVLFGGYMRFIYFVCWGKWVTIFLNRCINVVVVFIWCVYRVGLLKVKSQIPKSKIQNRKTSGTGVPLSNEKTDACFTIFCIYCVFCIKTICAHTCAPASRVGGCGMPAGGCSTRMSLLTARPRG